MLDPSGFQKIPYPTLPYFSYFPYTNLKINLEENFFSNIGLSSLLKTKTGFRKIPFPTFPNFPTQT